MNMVEDELVVSDPASADAEAFRQLRARLLMGPWGEGSHRALAVLSTDRGDGRSYVCANLAASLSQLGRRTLLVDADSRHPRLHEIFDVENDRGLSTCLAEPDGPDCAQRVRGFPFLSILPAGPLPASPRERVHTPEFAAWMQRATREYDLVVLDTPCAQGDMEALAIAALARYALLLGRNGQSRLRSVQSLLAALADAGVHVTGVVMNDH